MVQESVEKWRVLFYKRYALPSVDDPRYDERVSGIRVDISEMVYSVLGKYVDQGELDDFMYGECLDLVGGNPSHGLRIYECLYKDFKIIEKWWPDEVELVIMRELKHV